MDFQEEKLRSLCNALGDESKSRRRSTLNKLRQETLDKFAEQENLDELFKIIFEPVLKKFSDPAEKCRELSIQLIFDFLPRVTSIDDYMTYLVTVLLKRIDDVEKPEPSEEIRLLLVSLLCQVIAKSGKSLTPYLNDVTKIICKGLEDPFPKIKSESCDCILELTKAIPRDFHVQSETFLKSVLPGVSHKHSKVRVTSIYALGAVVQFGTHGLVEQATSVLAERLYDSNFSVRQAVICVSGEWMRRLNDRYSQFARLLPLVLTGLDDCLPDVVESASAQWQKAGAQFLAENEEDFKSHIDFLSDQLSDLQLQEQRPSLGCRLLAQKEAGKLFVAALAELHDWTLAVRLQAASLVYQLVRHLEHRSTQYVAKLWPDFALVCADAGEDDRLQHKIKSTLRLVGYFVPPATLLSVALPQEQLTHGQLCCVATALQGVTSLPQPDVLTLAHALAATRGTSIQLEYQTCLVVCVDGLLKVAENNSCNDEVALSLLRVLLCAQGHGDFSLSFQSQVVLHNLAESAMLSLDDLYTKHGHAILSPLVASVPVWTDHCAEKSLFTAFVQAAGCNIGGNLTLVAQIVIAWSKVMNSAKALTDFLRVCQMLLNWSFVSTLGTPQSTTEHFVSSILTEAILPNLVWKAGRVAEAKRSQAMLCLLVTVSNTDVPANIVTPLQATLLPLLVQALEESDKKLRMHAAQALAVLCPRWSLSAEHVYKTYSALAKRLDDTGEDVRLLALSTIQDLLLALPDDHTALRHSAQLEELFKMMLIHLDDQDPKYQQAILDALMTMAKLESATLLQLVCRGQKNFKNQHACNTLRNHLETLIKS